MINIRRTIAFTFVAILFGSLLSIEAKILGARGELGIFVLFGALFLSIVYLFTKTRV